MHGHTPSPFEGRAAHGQLRVNAIAFIPGMTEKD